MNDIQKAKRKFRTSKDWKAFRVLMRKLSDNKDAITNKPLRKGYQLHHRNLDETKYAEIVIDNFLCCNNLTHKMIHWLWTYYKTDPKIIDRLKSEMERMAEINGK